MSSAPFAAARIAAALRFACAAIAGALISCAAGAQTLRIGLSGPITTLGPHVYNTTPNNEAAFHVFDRLTQRSADGRLQPGLALTWRPLSDVVWEFTLRPGVRWHDGTAFAAADVAFSLQRARHVPNAIGGYDSLVRTIDRVEVVDPLTVRVVTHTASPGLPGDLAFISIVSEHVGTTATTADYNAGRADIGTGPYAFARYLPGDRLVLTRNDAWWGPKPEWATVVLTMVPNIAARTAALLAGDLDMIEAPSAADLPKLRATAGIAVFAVPGGRVGYINPVLDQAPDAPPVTDTNGKPLAATPLRDVRVRRALSIAINRAAITDRVMLGTGTATGQWMPAGAYSYARDVGVPAYDPVAAKALLASAGYPDGFNLILSTATDRTPYSVEIAQAVAQMWSRIGVATTIDAMPFAVYSARGARRHFQAYLGSLANPSMEAGLLLRSLLATPDPATGAGTYNWSGYSNPALDALTVKAFATVDAAAREAVLLQAVTLTAQDVPFMPIYQFQNVWATRAGIAYTARADEMSLAMGAHTVPAR